MTLRPSRQLVIRWLRRGEWGRARSMAQEDPPVEEALAGRVVWYDGDPRLLEIYRLAGYEELADDLEELVGPSKVEE